MLLSGSSSCRFSRFPLFLCIGSVLGSVSFLGWSCFRASTGGRFCLLSFSSLSSALFFGRFFSRRIGACVSVRGSRRLGGFSVFVPVALWWR
ncbi:MAG: hypothetical protein KKD18_07310, partial [Nanoarchaeota archaeon]|nr:hypothetical protein [Nanoarchaeota archaeon]